MKYSFLLFIFLFSCGAKKDKNLSDAKKNDSIITYTFNKKALDRSKLELQNSFKKSKTDIIFLGDSKTEGFPLQEIFNNLNIKNRGIAGNTTSDVLSRLNFVTEGKPREVFLEIGVNDLSNNVPVVKTFENFKMICNRFKKESPETKIFVQSVLTTTMESKALNPKIQEYNKLLYSFCQSNKLTYIDINSHFLSGLEMNKKYTLDGIHLNAEGYLLWGKLLENYVN